MREPAGSDVVFISRGHGRGHAVPNIAIGEILTQRRPDLRIRFISYAAGAEVFRAHHLDVQDLNKPDRPRIMEMIGCFGKLFAIEKPLLVVAHEEFGA